MPHKTVNLFTLYSNRKTDMLYHQANITKPDWSPRELQTRSALLDSIINLGGASKCTLKKVVTLDKSAPTASGILLRSCPSLHSLIHRKAVHSCWLGRHHVQMPPCPASRQLGWPPARVRLVWQPCWLGEGEDQGKGVGASLAKNIGCFVMYRRISIKG